VEFLTEELYGTPAVGAPHVAKLLQRDLAPRHRVVSAAHDGHAALAQGLAHEIAAPEERAITAIFTRKHTTYVSKTSRYSGRTCAV
jgi:hypothetical protein